MPVFDATELKQTVHDVFSLLGATADEARRLQDHLVDSNLVGHDSHGVRVIPNYVDMIRGGDIVLGATLDTVTESPTHAVLDGNWGVGQLMGWRAVQLVLKKAKQGALAAVSLRNCSHLGRLGEYTQMIANEGLIGFVTVNGHGGAQGVAPWGGLERRLSVNPMSYAVPASDGVLMIDISPTVVAAGKVAVKALRGEPVPEGWIVDSEGRSTTDANALDGPPPGSLIPVGGHKGFALGLIVDILSGALSGGGCSRPDTERWGNATFILAINPAAFVGQQEFETEVGDFLNYVKSSRVAPGFEEILIPGEPENRERERRINEGIFIEDRTWNKIMEILDELKSDAQSNRA